MCVIFSRKITSPLISIISTSNSVKSTQRIIDPLRFVQRDLRTADVPEPIGTNTDLTHSPRYKPFSALVFAVWDPLRTHERETERLRDGTAIQI